MILEEKNEHGGEPPQSAGNPKSTATPAPMFLGEEYTIRLQEVFQGPMDLLLHLVREQEVEIHEIEIAKVIDGYLGYLESLKELDVEYAGDFLVMAATLMAIKSRSLLPHDEVNLEDELDPKDELIERLIEYRRTKEAADDLHSRFERRSSQFDRGWHGEAKRETPEKEYDLGEVTVWDLLSTFSRLMRETMSDRTVEIESDPRPMRFYMDQVVHRLRNRGFSTLREMMSSLANVPPREALVGSFIALLELAKLELVTFRQDHVGDDIHIEFVEGKADDAESLLAQVGSEVQPEEPADSSANTEAGQDAEMGTDPESLPENA